MGPKVRPFPWERVPRIPRAAWLEQQQTLSRVRSVLSVQRALAALGALIGATVSAEVVTCHATPRDASTPAELGVTFPATGLCVIVRPEPDLARFCVARLLKQEFELGWPDTELDPSLRGAIAALVLEVARRAAPHEGPELISASEPEGDWTLCYAATLRIEGRAYRLTLECERLRPGARAFALGAPLDLGRLGTLPLAVPWVAALFWLSPQALAAAALGDVWLPRAGWIAPSPHVQQGILAPPGLDWGLPVDASQGKIVLGAEAQSLGRQEPVTMDERPDENHTSAGEPSALEQIVGETPIVVRLEIGSLELTAREWASLSPGDVVQSGRRLDEPVILRVMGRELARGELVEVDGELGVRITSLSPLSRGAQAEAGADATESLRDGADARG
jgi:flagellar motor switch/type III secretory pathway protein FliN